MDGFQAGDGRSLAAEVHGHGDDWLIVAGGTGIPARFYRRTAAHMAERGFRAMTFDYRGIATNRTDPLRHEAAEMADWGRLDLAGAIDHAAAQGASSIRLLTHSVGGQLFWFLPNADKVRSAVSVSSQSGYWRHWRPQRRPVMWALWHVVMPAATMAGRPFPSAAFGMGEALPPRVARQWARWGRHDEYLWQEPDATPADFPLLAVTVEDDIDFAPAAAVEALADRHGGPVDRVTLRGRDDALGHFGPFRQGMGAAWDQWADWLLAH